MGKPKDSVLTNQLDDSSSSDESDDSKKSLLSSSQNNSITNVSIKNPKPKQNNLYKLADYYLIQQNQPQRGCSRFLWASVSFLTWTGIVGVGVASTLMYSDTSEKAADKQWLKYCLWVGGVSSNFVVTVNVLRLLKGLIRNNHIPKQFRHILKANKNLAQWLEILITSLISAIPMALADLERDSDGNLILTEQAQINLAATIGANFLLHILPTYILEDNNILKTLAKIIFFPISIPLELYWRIKALCLSPEEKRKLQAVDEKIKKQEELRAHLISLVQTTKKRLETATFKRVGLSYKIELPLACNKLQTSGKEALLAITAEASVDKIQNPQPPPPPSSHWRQYLPAALVGGGMFLASIGYFWNAEENSQPLSNDVPYLQDAADWLGGLVVSFLPNLVLGTLAAYFPIMFVKNDIPGGAFFKTPSLKRYPKTLFATLGIFGLFASVFSWGTAIYLIEKWLPRETILEECFYWLCKSFAYLGISVFSQKNWLDAAKGFSDLFAESFGGDDNAASAALFRLMDEFCNALAMMPGDILEQTIKELPEDEQQKIMQLDKNGIKAFFTEEENHSELLTQN